ncbi:MAG: DUF819 family protein, partial [Bacteroidales bacterium]|nr:DUF819 family protein [Bacteroidales bacterium]
IIFYITFPVVLIWLTRKSSVIKKIGAIVLAYAIGIVIANVGILPRGSEAFREFTIGEDRAFIPKSEVVELVASGTLSDRDNKANNVASIQDSVQSVIIPLALPLILFSLNVRRWLKFSGKGFLSMLLALISVMVIVATGYLMFRDKIPDCEKIGGMLIGCYTGGTVNMAPLAVALNVEPNAFVMTNTYDMIIGGLTILFFITLGPAFFRWFLPAYKGHDNKSGENLDFDTMGQELTEEFDDFSGMLKRGTLLPLLGALGLAVLIFAAGLGVSFLVPKVPLTVSVLLTITPLGVAASFIPRIRKIKKTFQAGMYLIIAFSLVISSRCDLSVIFQARYISLLLYVTYAYFGSLLLHLFLSWIFRIDADDYLITTTGFVYSPPFVPMVAAALKNKDVILTGLATGIIGWIIGNYVGVAFGMWLDKL